MSFRPDYQRLFSKAADLQSKFATAEPFSHVMIDDFLDAPSYALAKAAYPAPDDPVWTRFDAERVGAKSVSQGEGHPLLKDDKYSDAARDVLRELNSASFLHFLERLSGIIGLISDPYFVEGGFHMIDQGGFLDIHADFSHHGHVGLERRLNLLLYLNDDWQPEWGGAIGLYDKDAREVQAFSPIGNRAVIFATSKTSYHGHPHKMENPPGTYRRSIALYYYSLPRSERENRRIIFPETPQS